MAASIAPVNAALAVELARPYLRENGQVLDPFCGVGTMLTERAKALPAHDLYGVDIYRDAIEKARRNAENADAWFITSTGITSTLPIRICLMRLSRICPAARGRRQKRSPGNCMAGF